jgi:hypothetical protein
MGKNITSYRIFQIIVAINMYNLGIVSWLHSPMKLSPPKPDARQLASQHVPIIPTYTEALAKVAVRPSSWQCVANDENDVERHAANYGTIFAFIHIYKTAGSTIRSFFHELAFTCHKTWVSLARCTGLMLSSIESRGRWNPCTIEEVADGRGQRKAQYFHRKEKNYNRFLFSTISNPTFERKVDIFGGHVRLGSGDYIFQSSPALEGVRYIVFLRDPVKRYVSGVLYQNKVLGRSESLEQVVQKIKVNIFNARNSDQYWNKSLSYLLTPAQRVDADKLSTTKLNVTLSSTDTPPFFGAEARAMLAIRNLFEYNVIVGMTERMPESLAILRHVFLTSGIENPLKDDAEAVFRKYGLVAPLSENVTGNHTAPSVPAVAVHENQSSRKNVSTSAVVAELAKDDGHMLLMDEYVKYERMISDFARRMHNLQYDCVMRGSIDN